MRAIGVLKDELTKIGYSAIENDYVFSDVFMVAPALDRTVPLAAFTHSPPSYRNAAVAVVENNQAEPAEVASNYRALGAPLIFVVEGGDVSIWQAHPHSRPTPYMQRISLDQVEGLFAKNKELWSPQRIHRAKSFGGLDRSHQLDFVDIGLLPAIEVEIHGKLDRLLSETLSDALRLRIVRSGDGVDERLLFRTVFRLLAAKVLHDRRHEIAQAWDPTDIDSVLKGISGYYKLPPLPGESKSFKGTAFEAAWDRLRGGINFQNISSDSLAFIYENTLVTPETRKHFGTHSTPRAVAEYIANRLELWKREIPVFKAYEPFAGAGAFMVAALRSLNDLLPIEMGAPERHKYLVSRIYGDEIEPFAREVANLSLILADYPNENGWEICEKDLFERDALWLRSKDASVVLCNPPFGKFSPAERERYPQAAARSTQKAIAALASILDNRPNALGFVLPEHFIRGRNYKAQRHRIEAMYKNIELVELPDRVFKASVIRSSLLIAKEPRSQGDVLTELRSTVIKPQDRSKFLSRGEVSETRTKTRPFRSNGDLWIEELGEVWEYLSNLPRLVTVAEIHRGIEWEGEQSAAISAEPQDGFAPGVPSANAVHAFALDKPFYLKNREGTFRKRTAAYKLPWQTKKIIANAARLTRGSWCFAAAIDEKGLLASQQLFGIWLRQGAGLSLYALNALLNNPVAVAYIATHSPPDRIRVETVRTLPIPPHVPRALDELVENYQRILRHVFSFSETESQSANAALTQIDATILGAYDLPPRLERQLLEFFRGDKRPTVHPWQHWFPEDFRPSIPLKEYISDQYQMATGGWVLDVFKPLPDEEATALRDYLD